MRDSLKAAAPMLVVVVVGLGIVGLALGGLGILSGSAKEMELLDDQAMVQDSNATIPAIDAAAPTETETATFALG